MRRVAVQAAAIQGLAMRLATAVAAQGETPLSKCASDAVRSGSLCIDRYEASVWRVANLDSFGLLWVEKIRRGNVTLEELLAGARQLGSIDDYNPCLDNGTGCSGDSGNIFAVSLKGVSPSRHITWFQAQQACKNSRKRLPTSAEWQQAAAGTPDPGGDDAAKDCNTATTQTVVPTGSREHCVSADGAFDMVGNLREWGDDWVPLSTGCGAWPSSISSSDLQCLSGASAGANDKPGALLRGGGYLDGTAAGPFAIDGRTGPSTSAADIGFRCVR